MTSPGREAPKIPPRPPPRPPDRADRWPAIALLTLVFATGAVMGAVALRGLNALQAAGSVSRAAIVVAVGVPAVIAGAIVGFGLVLVKRLRLSPFLPHPAASEPGRISRLLVFLVPLVVVAQMAAALLGGGPGSGWSAFLLAALVPLVPAAVVGFGALLLTADSRGERHRGRAPSRLLPPTEPPKAGLD